MTKTSIAIDGYLIQKRAFKNNSLIVTFLTSDGQLLNAIMYQGQKKSLILFCHYYLDVYIRDGLSLINKLEPYGKTKQLAEQALFCGLYVNELIGLLGKGLFDSSQVYIAYQNVITKLSSCQINEFENHLRLFEFIFLKHLGYELDFKADQNGLSIDQEQYYELIPTLGFAIGRNQNNNFVFKGSELLNIDINKLSNKNSLKSLKIINRIRIDYLLDGKELQSRNLFKK